MSGTSTDSSVMVSISAVSAVQDTVESGFMDVAKMDSLSDAASSSSFAPLTISSQDTAHTSSSTTAATTSEPRAAVSEEPKKNDIAAPLILLPPVEIESRATNNNNNSSNNNDDDGGVSESTDPLPSKNAQLPKQATKAKTIGAASATPKIAPKPAAAAGTKKPLSASTGRAAGATTAVSVGRTKSATSSLTKTSLASSASATQKRPPIPDSLKRSATAAAPSTSSSTAARSTAITSSSKSLSPSNTSQLRKSPSTPSLAGNSTSTGRRVASSSGADIGSSPRSSPSGTPGPTRSPSQASVTPPTASTTKRPAAVTSVSSSSVPSRSSTPTASAAAAPGHCRRTGAALAPNPIARQVNPTSAFSKPIPKPVLVVPTPPPPAVRKTPAASTTTSTTKSTTATTRSTTATTTRPTTATTTRPVTDAVKVKMLSTQLTGLQEKHERTLQLLREQEEQMKRDLEGLTSVPEPQRKPIPSDVQEVLKEMEELRKQFSEAKAQHEKALEELAAERALEVSQLKEAHEALMSTLTKEKDTLAESLEVLQETGELTAQEKDDRIKELEEKIESSLQRHADAVSKHAEALESLRVEIESSWAKKHEAAILDLTKVHEERIKALEEKVSGSVKEAELQKLKNTMDEQIKELEDEQESRILELIAMHELDIQDLKDNLRNQADAHEELLAHMKQEHAEEIDRLQSSKAEAESQTRELKLVRAELEQVRTLLISKDTEVAELMKRITELTKDLENASMSTLLKNTEKYKVKRVQVYGSSVSGNYKIKRAQQSISDTLERNEIEYEFVDISASQEDKQYMRRKNGGELQLPQIFSDGEYRGVFEDFEYALETHQLLQFLAFDRVRPFVPRQKASFDSSHTHFAQDGEDAEQGAGLPDLVVNGMNDRPTTTMGALRPRSNTDMGTSRYLLSPGSKQFLPRSNGSSRGFVQAASQAWEGALREDITKANHDLGIGAVTPDDDELEELYEKGEVSEADLEAMVNSF